MTNKLARIPFASVLVTWVLVLVLTPVRAEEPLPPKKPTKVETKPVAEAPMSTLDLEWESVDEADGYQLKLTPKQGGEALIFPTEESKISQKIPSGTYMMQIRSKEKATGYFGAWSESTEIDVAPKVVTLLEPKDLEVIPEPKEKRRDVTLVWQAIPGVRHYHLRIWEEGREEKGQDFVTTNATKTLKLSTGHAFFWSVTIEDEKSVRYDTKPTPFKFTLLGKQLLTPVIDTKISRSDVTGLQWQLSPDAKTYRVRLETKFLDETEWRIHREIKDAKDLKLAFEKLVAGNYRFEVIAEAPQRVSSDPAKFEFTIKPSESELAEKLSVTLAQDPPPTEAAKAD